MHVAFAAATIIAARATLATAQERVVRPGAAPGRDTAYRHQAIALLQSDDTLPFLKEGRITLVAHALRSIHAQFPRLDDIVPNVDGTRMELSIVDSATTTIVARSDAKKPATTVSDFWHARLTSTGIPALDSLNAAFDVRRMTVSVSEFGTTLHLEFRRPVNVPALRTAYQRIPQVDFAARAVAYDVYSWIVLFDKGRTLDLAFARGGGDCPSGCTEWDYYYVAYDTLTHRATMEREVAKTWSWSEPIAYWDVPSRLSINAYSSYDSLIAGTRDNRWWHRSHAVTVLGLLLGPAISPWGGAGEQIPERFRTLKRAALARQQESYGAIVDRLGDPDRDVARVALANLRAASRRSFTADRAGVAQWQRWLHDLPAQLPPLEIRFIDVGKGDAILIRQGRLAALIDAGLPNDSIVERLRALDVDSLQLFVTSNNQDEHIGSAAALILAMPVRLFVDNDRSIDSPAQRGVRDALRLRRVVERRGARQVIMLSDSRIEIIAPPAAMGAPPNDRSLTVRIERGAFQALLTGHGEESETDTLVAAERLAHVNVLQAPRYRNADTVSGAWLRRLAPDVVVVSSADVSAIESAIRRYNADGRTVVSPHWDGDVVVIVYDDGTYSLQTRSGRQR